MSSPYDKLSKAKDADVLAWDSISVASEEGATYRPWRQFWPPSNVQALSAEELRSKPWLTWKRDDAKPNEKPWYQWVNIFKGEVDVPCRGRHCEECGGSGCSICSTVAEGG